MYKICSLKKGDTNAMTHLPDIQSGAGEHKTSRGVSLCGETPFELSSQAKKGNHHRPFSNERSFLIS
jgi:hypothetical protein